MSEVELTNEQTSKLVTQTVHSNWSLKLLPNSNRVDDWSLDLHTKISSHALVLRTRTRRRGRTAQGAEGESEREREKKEQGEEEERARCS